MDTLTGYFYDCHCHIKTLNDYEPCPKLHNVLLSLEVILLDLYNHFIHHTSMYKSIFVL